MEGDEQGGSFASQVSSYSKKQGMIICPNAFCNAFQSGSHWTMFENVIIPSFLSMGNLATNDCYSHNHMEKQLVKYSI